MVSPQLTCGRGRWNRLAGVLACALLVGTAQAGSEAPPLTEIAAFDLMSVELPATNGEPEAFSANVLLDGTAYELELAPHSMRAGDFRVLVYGDSGELVEVAAPAPTTYRGQVKGIPNSVVHASRHGDALHAMISLAPDTPFFVVQPLAEVDGAAAAMAGPTMHVSFRHTDVADDPDHKCGFDEVDQPMLGAPPAEADPTDGTGLASTEIALDADYQFYQLNGSSVENTVADMENVINSVEFIYERDVDVTFEVTVIVIRTSSATNPYTSSDGGTLLCQFRQRWNTGPEDDIRRDVAELFTGRNIIGGTIGVAWLSTVCNVSLSVCGTGGNAAYSIVQSRFTTIFSQRVAVSAHEIGHNFSALHCDGAGTCRIMCSGLGSCGSVTSFAPISISSIAAFAGSRACLDEQPPSLSPPFLEEVDTVGLDGTKWTYNWPKTTVSTDAVNEPSEPFAIACNANGSGDFDDDDLRTNYIDLLGESDLFVSYYTQYRDLAGVGKLFIEYKSSGDDWVLLNTVTGTATDQDEFEFHQHALPFPSAYHDRFRLRFRVDVGGPSEFFYVDDIRVGPEFFPPDDCVGDLDDTGDVGFSDLLSVLAAWGPCVGCPQDFDDSGEVGFADLLVALSAFGPCP